MFGSNNFSVKKLAAFSAVLSIILMSCGGSSTSSNAGRSKNATVVDGVCVLEQADVDARDASLAKLALAEDIFDEAWDANYVAYKEKKNAIKDVFYQGYGGYYDDYYYKYNNNVMTSPYYNGPEFYDMYNPYYNDYMYGYNGLEVAFESALMSAEVDLKIADNAVMKTRDEAYNVAGEEATARQNQYFADCGELTVSAQADYEAAVSAANDAFENDTQLTADFETTLLNAEAELELRLKGVEADFDECLMLMGDLLMGDFDECETAFEAALDAAFIKFECIWCAEEEMFTAASVKKDAAIAAAAEVRDLALASISIPNEPPIVADAIPEHLVTIEVPIEPLPPANPGDPAPAAEVPALVEPEVEVIAQVVAELDNVVASEVDENTTINCDKSCIDSLQFSARTEGDVYVQVAKDGKIKNDEWVKIDSDTSAISLSKPDDELAVQVRPLNASEPITMKKQASQPYFETVDVSDIDTSSNGNNRIIIGLSFIGLFLLTAISIINLKKRKL